MIFLCSSSACSRVSPKTSPSICGDGISPPATTFVQKVEYWAGKLAEAESEEQNGGYIRAYHFVPRDV